jgi:hypothetical protein
MGGGTGQPPRSPRDVMGAPPRAPAPRPRPPGSGGSGAPGGAAPSEILRRQEELSARRGRSPAVQAIQGQWNEKFLSKYNLKKHSLF